VERCYCFSRPIILIRISSLHRLYNNNEILRGISGKVSLKLEGVYEGLDPAYQAKASILNEAIQEIGMGRYQWYASGRSLLDHI